MEQETEHTVRQRGTGDRTHSGTVRSRRLEPKASERRRQGQGGTAGDGAQKVEKPQINGKGCLVQRWEGAPTVYSRLEYCSTSFKKRKGCNGSERSEEKACKAGETERQRS